MITNQCVGCHMQTTPYVSDQKPANSGHSFRVTSFETCRQCHPDPEGLVVFTTGAVSNQISYVKWGLDVWASTKAPEALRLKYGTRAWEYTTPGSLSPGGPGPTTSEQALIPDNIKKARFDLYLVLYDGSFGIHNAPLATTLLDSSLTWIQAELKK